MRPCMRIMNRRSFALFALIALVGAFVITRGLIAAPGYTDVYYHLNAANRLASGQGLTDPYVWTYIGALDHLPMPSHLYWMPLTSVIAGVSMSAVQRAGRLRRRAASVHADVRGDGVRRLLARRAHRRDGAPCLGRRAADAVQRLLHQILGRDRHLRAVCAGRVAVFGGDGVGLTG